MEILKINKEDLDIIYNIDNENFVYDSYNIDTINKFFLDNNTLFLKIIQNNEIVGYSIVLLIKPDAELLKICIKENYRSLGYAKKLLDFNIDYLKKNNYDCIFLEVRSDNYNAIKLYDKLGFIKYNERKKYYKDTNVDALLYKKILIN